MVKFINMLVYQRYTIFLQQNCKILKVLPAYNQSFVLLIMNKHEFGQKIIHIDINGKYLYQYKLALTLNVMTMSNDHTIVYTDNDENFIGIINLITKIIQKIPFQFIVNNSAPLTLYFFNKSKLTCLIERGFDIMHLTYINQNGNVFWQYTTKQAQFQHTNLVTSGNLKSMIIWFPKKLQENIILWLYEPQLYKQTLTLKIDISFSKRQLQLINAWQCSPGFLLITCDGFSKNIYEKTSDNTNFVYSIKDNTLRKTAFQFKQPKNEKIAYQQNFGKYSLFATFEHKQGQSTTSPLYIIDDELQLIVAQTTYSFTASAHIYAVSYRPDMFLLAYYPNDSVRKICVISSTIQNMRKSIMMKFMLKLQNNFDDDLLQETLHLLELL